MNRSLKGLLGSAWLELAARWFLGLIFVYSSFPKIMEPALFAKIIYGYYLFPGSLINLMAIVIPFVELFGGLALILGVFPRSAVLMLNALLLAFIFAIGVNLIRGQEFDCGCFSFSEPGYRVSPAQMLFRDLLFLAVGLQILFYAGLRKACLLQTGSLRRNLP